MPCVQYDLGIGSIYARLFFSLFALLVCWLPYSYMIVLNVLHMGSVLMNYNGTLTYK